MASRNYAQVAPTAATMALNAYIYGYGGHSLVTPHAALKRLWWTNERIDAKVTRPFVVSKLRGEEREFLDKPLAFGEGLTDDTYMEWILERSKRLFLILAEIGVPDQIFGCIDDSWDDDDLPLPLESVRSLELAYENDEPLNKKFYDMQFVYLLRELKQGSHIDYGPKEHIPMEHVNTMPPAVTLQPYDRVHFPKRPDDVFIRRKYSITDRETGHNHREAFLRDTRKAKRLTHQHIAPIFATYISENSAFTISDFVPEHTLNTFIEHRTPTQFQRLPAQERPILMMQWMHCLSDALASLHHRGVAHTQIRPSNIWITKTNQIAFGDVGSIATLQRNKKSPKTEAYDYAAPEQQITKTPVTLKSSSPPISSMNAFSRLRKMSSMSSSDTSSSTSGSSGASSTRSTRSNSICTAYTTPPSSNGRSNSLTTIRTALSPVMGGPRSPTGTRNFSRHLQTACPSPTIPTGPLSPSSISSSSMLLPIPASSDPDLFLPATAPEMSDIYSLACTFLDLLTFTLRGKNSDFLKFRSTRILIPSKNQNNNSNKTRTDTSFHCDPEKISAWIDILEEDSYRHPDQVFRGIPELLRLLRTMLLPNPALRPTALEVRNRILEILVADCGIETLCCAGRQWAEPPPQEQDDDDDEARRKSPFRRDCDDLSIATGLLGPSMAPKKVRVESLRCSTSYGAGDSGGDGMSVRSRAESTMTARRRSSVGSATARFSSWRSRFLRSG